MWFSPQKSLRHPHSIPFKRVCLRNFQTLIEDKTIDVKKAKKLVFCTGKFYYDLLKERDERNIKDVALVRLEQLFPLPIEEIKAQLEKYTAATNGLGTRRTAQYGRWSHLLLHMPEAANFRPASRRFYGAPAAGSATRSTKRHKEVIDYVFDETKIILFVNKIIHKTPSDDFRNESHISRRINY